jgi:hypothetical protein
MAGNSLTEAHEMTTVLMFCALVGIALGGLLRDRNRRAD